MQKLFAFLATNDGSHVVALAASISALVATVVSLIWNSIRDWAINRRLRRGAALAAATALERYARKCAMMIHRAGWAARQTRREQKYDVVRDSMLPPFAFPESVEWDLLKAEIHSKLLEFPAAVDDIRDELGRFVGRGLGFEFFNDVQYRCAQTGLKAIGLAQAVRSAHCCPPAELSAEVKAELSRALTQGEKLQRENEMRMSEAEGNAANPLDDRYI